MNIKSWEVWAQNGEVVLKLLPCGEEPPLFLSGMSPNDAREMGDAFRTAGNDAEGQTNKIQLIGDGNITTRSTL